MRLLTLLPLPQTKSWVKLITLSPWPPAAHTGCTQACRPLCRAHGSPGMPESRLSGPWLRGLREKTKPWLAVTWASPWLAQLAHISPSDWEGNLTPHRVFIRMLTNTDNKMTIRREGEETLTKTEAWIENSFLPSPLGIWTWGRNKDVQQDFQLAHWWPCKQRAKWV